MVNEAEPSKEPPYRSADFRKVGYRPMSAIERAKRGVPISALITIVMIVVAFVSDKVS